MRVKLSYTVEEEKTLIEAARILGLCGGEVQQVIALFQGVQAELSQTDSAPDVEKALGMLAELRKSLIEVDVRALEIVDIVEGYEEYKLSGDESAAPESSEED